MYTFAMYRFSLAVCLLVCSAPAQGVLEAAEPNGSIATATALATGQQGYGDITAGDEDWFRITLASDQDYKVWTAPGFSGQIGDTRVRLLDAQGVELRDVDGGSTLTHGFYTAFTGTLAAGDYFVAVRGQIGTMVGSYTLDVVLAPLGTYWGPGSGVPHLIIEFPEDNDPRNAGGVATASHHNSVNVGAISVATPSASYIDPFADYDFFEFTVIFSATLEMEVNPATTSINDTVIFLVDGSYNLLAFDDDNGTGLLSKLSWPVTPGTYSAVIKSRDPGFYSLDLGVVSQLPVGVGTVTIRSGGCAGSAATPLLGTRLSSTGLGVRPELPILGSTFYVDGQLMPANAPLLRVIGLDPLSSPFDLSGLGAPGCQIEVDPIDQSFALADGNGVDFWGLGSPASIAFVGLTIEQQLVVLDAGANALGLSTSNRVSSVFGVTH